MSRRSTRRSRHENAELPTLKRGNPPGADGRLGEQQFRNIPGEGLVHLVKADTGWKKMSTSTGGTTAGDSKSALRPTSVTVGASGDGGTGTGTAVSSHNLLDDLITQDDHTQYVHNTIARTVSANHTYSGNPSFSNIDINGGTINNITNLAIADGGTGADDSNAWLNTRVTTNANGSLNYDATGATAVNHDSLADFVADEHIAHSGVSVTAGTGLTGGGTIAATRTLNVIGSSTITANADSIQVATDSIGDAQLTYNTGQHLTDTSGVVFATVDTGQGANDLYDMDQNVLTTSSVAFAGLDLNGGMTITGNITGDSGDLTVASSTGSTLVEGSTFTGNNVVIPGNLTVQGASVTLTTAEVQVEDKNILLAYNNTTGDTAAKNLAADGGGVSLKAAEDKHFVWYKDTDRWTASEDVEAPGLYLKTNTETKITLHDTAGPTDVTIGTSNAGDMILTAVSGQGVTVDNNNHLGGTSFVSGFAGSGWRVTKDASNEYNAEFDNLIVRGTMSVYELLIQQIRATNGSIMVTSADKVIEIDNESGGASGIYKFTIEADDSDDFIHFTEDDLIIAQKWAGTSGDPPYTPVKRVRATVTETSNSSSSSLNGQEFRVDLYGSDTITDADLPMDFVRIGNTSDADRQGGIYLTSEDSGAPFIDIFNDVDSWADWRLPAKTKARLGKLDGITHQGTNLTSYGLFSDRVFLTGNMTATSGYIGSTDEGWTIDSDQIYNGNVKLNANNETMQLGTVTDFTNDDNTKSGIYMGKESSGNYDFFVGKEDTQFLHYDDSAGTIKIKGTIQLADGTNVATGLDGDIYATTSSTSVAIPTSHSGTDTAVTITVSTGLAYTVGQSVLVANAADKKFTGTVTSYTTGTGVLVLDSVTNTGTGTFSSWDVNLEGAPGPQGEAGTAATTYYTWVKYGTSAAGAGLTDDYNAGTTLYIGMAFQQTVQSESTDPNDYTWNLIEGTDGVPGTDGDIFKQFYVYRNAANAGAAGTPSGGSVNSSGVLSSPSDWDLTSSSPSAGNYTFISSSTWKQTEGTGAFAIDTAWSAAAQLSGATGATGETGEDGDDGDDGAPGADNQDFTFANELLSTVDTDPALSAGLLMTSSVFGFHNGIDVGDGTNAQLSDFKTYMDSSGNFHLTGTGGAGGGSLSWISGTSTLQIVGDIAVTNTDEFADVDATDGLNDAEAAQAIISASGLEVKNDSAVSLAEFGATVRVGRIGNDLSRLEIDSNGNLEIINRQVSTDTTVISLDKDGNAAFTGNVSAATGNIAGITLSGGKVYVGTGTYNNANTTLYMDDSGNFSLEDKLAWNGSTLSIDGTVVIGSTAASTIESGAASGGTANQDSTSTILGGNLTGTVDGTAVGTVKDGAADGATANQDSTSTIRAVGAATSGTVGGWTITSSAITGSNIVMSSSGNIAVSSGYSLNNDGSADFANGAITFETNGDITSNDFLIERTRLFGAGQDSWNGSSYVDGWISSTTRSSAYGENTYAINVPPETASEISNGYGARIMARSGGYWFMHQDAYFKNFTIKSGTYLVTKGYRIFCSGTLTIENNAHIENDGSSASAGSITGAAGGVSGTLYGGASGQNGGRGGDGHPLLADQDGFDAGGGGGGGGMVFISARYVVNNGTIRAKGGNGGNGAGIEY